MTHHPHIHMIVPGGGISLDGTRWVSSRPAFLLPVRVLSKLFRRLFLTRLLELHTAGSLTFFGDHAGLREQHAFLRLIVSLRKKNWVGSCPKTWCRSSAPWRVGPPCQAAMTGRLTMGSSLRGAMVSRLM